MKIITDREKQLVCDLYAKRMPLRKLASYANLSQTTCLKILRENGVAMRNGRTITKEQEDDVIRLYYDGLSILDIIEKTGVKSEQTIYRIFRDHNVKRRRNTEKAAE